MIDSVSPSLRNSASGLAGDSSKGSTASERARLFGRLGPADAPDPPDPERSVSSETASSRAVG